MKFQMNVSLTTHVEADDEAGAIQKLREAIVGDTTLTSTQIVPMPENQNV